jgi:hypothetical protein
VLNHRQILRKSDDELWQNAVHFRLCKHKANVECVGSPLGTHDGALPQAASETASTRTTNARRECAHLRMCLRQVEVAWKCRPHQIYLARCLAEGTCAAHTTTYKPVADHFEASELLVTFNTLMCCTQRCRGLRTLAVVLPAAGALICAVMAKEQDGEGVTLPRYALHTICPGSLCVLLLCLCSAHTEPEE